jgi:hypothetical protein
MYHFDPPIPGYVLYTVVHMSFSHYKNLTFIIIHLVETKSNRIATAKYFQIIASMNQE